MERGLPADPRVLQEDPMRWTSFLVWCVVLLLSAQAQGRDVQMATCTAERILLQPWLQTHDDAEGDLLLDDFLQLPADRLAPMDTNYLRRNPSSKALWLQFRITNLADHECRMWLFPGASRARDMRLYRQFDGQWQQSVAGQNWPLQQWDSSVRLPAFELKVPPGQSSIFILRMGDNPGQAMQPMLLSTNELARTRTIETGVDGAVFGIVGLLVLLSLAVGAIYRLPLLFVHAACVLFYVLFVATGVGYGFVYLWPDSPHLDQTLAILFRTALSVAAIAYLRLLLRVRQLPAVARNLMTVWQLLLVAGAAVQILFGVHTLNNMWVDWSIHLGMTCIVLAIVAMGWRYKLRYDWFCYLIVGLVVVQTLTMMGFALEWWELSPFEYSWYSVSTLPGAVLLVYTLVNQVSRGRRRENQALADIEQLKQSETERLEHAVAVRTSQLRDAVSVQNQLLARISHDLRTPMQGILNAARQLESDSNPHQHSQDIEQLASLQLEMIDELLEFSRNELQQLELLMAPGYLYGFLREMEQIGRFLARRNSNRFDCKLASDLPLLVNADFRRLRQLLANLLGNASKFTSQGSIELRVERGVDCADGRVTLDFAVEDSGIGIPPEEMARLTEPYQRASNARRHEGTGLGLYFVRQMLERLGSRLHIARSTLGGSRFSFSLALELAEEKELETVLEESYLPSVDGDNQRILLVDDAQISREMLYELLTGYGYEVDVCANVREACQRLAEDQPDLVISDQYMPNDSGWVLLAHIREQWPELPVILHSASPPHPPEQYKHLEFSASVLKPVRSDKLLRLIGKVLYRVPEPVG